MKAMLIYSYGEPEVFTPGEIDFISTMRLALFVPMTFFNTFHFQVVGTLDRDL